MKQSISKRFRGATAVEGGVDQLVALITSAAACAYCPGSLDEFGYAIDHVIPLRSGGTHDLPHLVMACTPCNRAKWNLSESDFRRWLHGAASRLVNPSATRRGPFLAFL